MIQTAKSRTVNGTTVLYCPNPSCNQRIGEMLGDRLVVRIRRSWAFYFPVIPGLTQTCPRCGLTSYVPVGDTISAK